MYKNMYKKGLMAILALVFSFLAASQAKASPIGTSTALSVGNPDNTVMAGVAVPVFRLDLNDGTSPLNSVAVIINSASTSAPTALAASSFLSVGIFQDSNSNGIFDQADTLLGTTTVSALATSTAVNISTSTPAQGTFFVVVKTSDAWTDNGAPEAGSAVPQEFFASLDLANSVYASSSPAAITGDATTTAFVADTHSSAPDPTKLNVSFSGGHYSFFAPNGLLGEAGSLSIYSDASGTNLVATSSLDGTGHTNFSLNSFYSTLWLAVNDAVGNATSSLVSYSLPAAPAVSSASVFTDRIILHTTQNLNGLQANNCANYLINGAALSCGGVGDPFIDFFGNSLTIRNLNLTQGSNISLAVSGIQDINADQFPLNYSNVSLPVQAAQTPTISLISPGSGKAGDTVTITGSKFGTSTGEVLFSGGFSPATGPLPPVIASTTAWSDTSITATVPAGALAGPLQVVASSGMSSDPSQNTFFNILGNLYIKLSLATSSSPIATSTNMDIAIFGSSNSMNIYSDGDANGTTFNPSTYTYTIPNVSAQGFVWAYDSSGANLAAPGMPLQPNTSSSSPQILTLAASTAYKVSGSITLGGASNANKYVGLMAMPQGTQINSNGVQPFFFETNGSGIATYSLALPGPGTYNVEAHLPPQTQVVGTLDPAAQIVTVTATSTTATANFNFGTAAHSIYGKIVGADGNPLSADKYSNLMVFAYQPVAGGQGTVAQPAADGTFRLYATTGAYKISVSGSGLSDGFETNVLVSTSTAFAVDATNTALTITLAPPTSYIEGYVKDSSGNAVPNVDVFAYCSNGPGGGHSSTDNQGYYKMYVVSCADYHVNGFSQSYGQLTEQSGISISNSSANATVNFTINGSNFETISGTVTQNGSPASGANVWITQGGDFGQSVAGGQTDSNGAFSLKVKSGLSNLYIHAAVMGAGELGSQQILDSGNATITHNVSGLALASSLATLTINLYPGNTFSQVFLGAHSSLGGGYTSTLVSTSTSFDTYQIQNLPYSGSTSYTIDGGIPGFGSIPAQTVAINSGSASANIDLSAINFYTVSGTVSGDFSDSYVWAGGSNGGGGTTVNPDGTFSLQLKQGTYDIGVNKPGYTGSLLPQENIATTTTGLSLALTPSSATISGTVQYNGAAIPGVNVWAENSAGGWAGVETDTGTFSLSVTPGNWILHAIANGYELSSPILVTAPATGLTVNLQAVAFQPIKQVQSLNPMQGGVIQTSDAKVSVPQGALGQGTNVQMSITNTMNIPTKKGAKVIGIAKDISAGNVTNVSQDVTLEFVLTKAQLTAGGITSLAQAENIKIGYNDPTSNAWTNLPTTVTLNPLGASWATLVSIKLSAPTRHFSTYAPVLPTNGSAPATPTGFQGAAGNGQATLSWTGVSGAANYNVYKLSGSSYTYTAQTAATSYTDSGLTNGTAYSYEVTSVDSNNNESAASAAVSVTPAASSGGGGGGGSIVSGSPLVTNTATTTPPVTPAATSTPEISQKANTNQEEEKAGNKLANQIAAMVEDSTQLAKASVDDLLSALGAKRDLNKERASAKKYLPSLIKSLTNVTKNEQEAVNNFLTYGSPTTLKIGEGERAGVLSSYKSAFGQLPSTAAQWSDAIKIANGRWPNARAKLAEEEASASFIRVYKHRPNLANAHDANAIMVIAYGLRPAQRNLASENAGNRIFTAIYGHRPQSALAWDIVRAIAYSGAKR